MNVYNKARRNIWAFCSGLNTPGDSVYAWRVLTRFKKILSRKQKRILRRHGPFNVAVERDMSYLSTRAVELLNSGDDQAAQSALDRLVKHFIFIEVVK